MSPIKDKLLSVIKKTILIILACLLGLCFLPVGLMPEKVPEKTDNFIRFFAEDERYPSPSSAKGIANIGYGSPSYLRFNLGWLLSNDADIDVDKINSVRLRLTFLKGSGELTNRINVNLADDNLWNSKNFLPPSHIGVKYELATIYPQTRGADDSLSEIDITEPVKESLLNGESQITIRLDADMQVDANMASGEYYDSSCRPYIKVVTGKAEDTDAYTFKRAELSEAVYVSQKEADKSGNSFAEQTDSLMVGDGNEMYLKFDINENSIFDTVYDVRLSLCQKSNLKSSKFKVSCINNNQWQGDITYNTLPRGEETVATEVTSDKAGRLNIDITGAVSHARTLGIKSLTLRIVGDETPVEFYGKNDNRRKPALYIRATDDKNIVCAARAGIGALGANPSSFLTMNLLDSYVSEDGTTAKIRWKEYDAANREITGRHISEDGTVKRPKWFEPSANVIAEAKIQSDNYTTKRRYYVTIPSTAAPNYTGYSFSNYIDIGNIKSENSNLFDSINTSGVKRKWISGRVFSYRTPDIDGAMLLNMSCMPDTDNYFTLKLWEGDDSSHCNLVISTCDEKTQSLTLVTPDDNIVDNKGFVYVTYKLPREFTDDKNFVSLRLFCNENSPRTKNIDNHAPRGVYAAYITQSAFFDPKAFAKQGEKPISEPNFGEGAIRKFIENLKSIFTSAVDEDLQKHLSTDDTTQKVTLNKNNGTAIYTGDETNIAFSLNKETRTADIYQKTDYYDKYSSGCPASVDGALTTVDFGNYKFVWNTSETEGYPLPHQHLEVSGVYKEVATGKYYTFSEKWQMTDDSVIPEDETLANGRDIVVKPDSSILLMHIADPMHESDWRVNKINSKLASKFTFKEEEHLNTLSVKAVGGITNGADSMSVILAVYDNDKLTDVYRREVDISSSINIYTLDFSTDRIMLKKGRTIRIFVFDNNFDMTKLVPTLEIS